MARTLLVISLVATSGSLLVACTQDFNVFKPGQGGAGGNAVTTSVSSSSSSSSSTGTGTQCTPTDLSKCDDMNPCTIESCDGAGMCKKTNAADGLAPGYTDDPTDCVDDTCAAGVYTHNAADNTEMPTDGNICTLDSCMMGMKVFAPDPAQENMSCGAGILHCVSGVCVGCNSPTDCPGTDTFCQVRTCSAQMQCGTMNQNQGMDLPAGQQTANDCKTKACDAGNIVNNNTNTDKPADTQCTTYSCGGGTLSTNNLANTTNCGNGPSCVNSTTQKAQDKCDGNGACVAGAQMMCMNSFNCASNACLTMCTVAGSSQCAGALVCDLNSGSANLNKCVECASNADCSNPTPACETTVPGNAKFDTCVACVDDTKCMGATPKCKTASGAGQFTCVECLADPDCPMGKPTCTNNVCM